MGGVGGQRGGNFPLTIKGPHLGKVLILLATSFDYFFASKLSKMLMLEVVQGGPPGMGLGQARQQCSVFGWNS